LRIDDKYAAAIDTTPTNGYSQLSTTCDVSAIHKPLFLSMLAAVQTPVIMMSQNRQDAKDRLRSKLDFRVN
jgi:hypothetical protein